MALDTSPPGTAPLAARLRNVRVGTREDLEVSRHVFRGDVSYVIRDPITFQSHRLDPHDYAIFCAITPDQTLGDTFARFSRQGELAVEDENAFYQFILALHGLGFLRLPVSDDALLYRRFVMKKQAKFRQKLTGFLFLRIPLWNPDAFLSRTIDFARPVFSRVFFVFWLLLIVTAGFVVLNNRHRLHEPLEGLLAAQNIPLLWLTLIVLKAFHEFGHAYACKHFGGHVPEMGAYLILFTPCAYVDATGCWAFTRKRDRIIVCLAGMYIESIFASFAVFAWAMTDASMIHSLAYNVMFLASVVTILFNINPLMRYDGYYVLSDLTEVPNLREKSGQYLLNVAKRLFLGIQTDQPPAGWRLRTLLLGFGIAAAIYRVTLVIGIAAVLATKWLFAGVAVATWYAGGTAITSMRSLTRYLIHAEETAPMRWRAAALAVIAIVALPAIVALVPVPSHVHAAGVLCRETTDVVRVRTPGFVDNVPIQPNQEVQPGDVLASLTNDEIESDLADAEARLRASSIRLDAYRVASPVRSLQEQAQLLALQASRALSLKRSDELHLVSPRKGTVTASLTEDEIGSFLRPGQPIATIVSGAWQVRALLTANELTRLRLSTGMPVEFRPASSASTTFEGKLVSITPAGSSVTDSIALTQLGGGDIVVEPITQTSAEPLFELVVSLEAPDATDLALGSTGTIRLAATTEPLGTSLIRRIHRFLNRLAEQ